MHDLKQLQKGSKTLPFFFSFLLFSPSECIIVKTNILVDLQVFLEYADVDSSSKARQGLNGRKFGGNQVIAVFYPENKFSEGDYEASL